MIGGIKPNFQYFVPNLEQILHAYKRTDVLYTYLPICRGLLYVYVTHFFFKLRATVTHINSLLTYLSLQSSKLTIAPSIDHSISLFSWSINRHTILLQNLPLYYTIAFK